MVLLITPVKDKSQMKFFKVQFIGPLNQIALLYLTTLYADAWNTSYLEKKIAWTSSELTYNMQSIWTFILQQVWFQNRSMNLLSIQSSFSLIDYTFIV